MRGSGRLDIFRAPMESAGGYALIERLGESRVLHARGADGQEVAIKRLRSAIDLDTFTRQARAVSALRHPHLAPVLAYGLESGPWIATEWIDAMTLRSLMGSRRLSPDAALLIVHPVVDALAALHAAGLVHGDVTPDNVLMSPLGDLSLVGIDFAMDSSVESPRYLSPERLEGRDVDATADVWALGALLYELVSGRAPFAAVDAGEEARAIREAKPVSLRELDPRVHEELDWLVSVCLARDPWARPRNASALMQRLLPLVPCAIEHMRQERVALLGDPERYTKRAVPKNEPAPPSSRKARHEAIAELDDDPPPRADRRRALLFVAGALVLLVALIFFWSRPSAPGQAREGRPTHAASSRDADAIPTLAPEWIDNDLPPMLQGLAAGEGERIFTQQDAAASLEVADAQLSRDRADVGAAIDRVVALFSLGRDREAQHALDSLAATNADDKRVLLLRGRVALRRASFDEAEQRFARALRVDAHYVDARLALAILLSRRGRARDAYADLREVLARRPNDLEALAELAQLYNRIGHAREAAPIIRRILRQNPRSADAWVDLSLALEDDSEALDAIDRALSLSPEDARALRQRCLLLSRNRGVGAIAACNRAIRALADDPELFLARAQVQARERRHSAALADADRAVELAPFDPRMVYERQFVRQRAGDSGGAFRDLSTACSLGHERACDDLRRSGVMP